MKTILDDASLVKKYIKSINISPNNTKKLFAIGFVGLTGSGKSTVANLLAKRLNLFIASNDHIRRFLNDEGYEGHSPRQELVQEIAEESSRYLYKNHISHIIDNDLMRFHESAKANARSNGAELFLLQITAPEDVVLERIKKRSQQVQNGEEANLSRVGIEEYFKRKELHASLTPPKDLLTTVDTSRPLDLQIDEIHNKLKTLGMI